MKDVAEDYFIPILSDYGFKVTFANPKNTLFLRKAIQTLIGTNETIERIRLGRNEFAGITRDSRGGLYDLFCTDAKGDSFIVEMQLGDFPHFIQRSKFYAFQWFNTMVQKGAYKFDSLKRIYCIGFLVEDIFDYDGYYHVGCLRNQHGEVMDQQLLHIIVELGKFEISPYNVETDLEKLLYTMKYAHTYHTKEPMKFPEFWTETWIKKAIRELDKSKMTPEERAAFEMTMAHNASVVDILSRQQAKRVKDEGIEEGLRKAQEAREKELDQTIQKMMDASVPESHIAEFLSISVERVRKVKTLMQRR